jgi:anti-anti-sigma factor
MEITTRKQDNAMVITAKGRLDAVSSPEFEKGLAELIAEGEKVLIIDFGELDYISSAGLRSILATAKKLKAKDGQLLLSALKDTVKKVFEVSGFSSIIPIHESVESALAQI